MPTKTITITVPASSFIDAVLCELSEVTPIPTWEIDEDFGERLAPGRSCAARFRKVAHTLAWLRRLGFLRDTTVDGWTISPTVKWRNLTGEKRHHKGERGGGARMAGDEIEWTRRSCVAR